MSQEKGMGKGLHLRALLVLMSRALVPRQPPPLAAPSPQPLRLDDCAGGGGRSRRQETPWGPAPGSPQPCPLHGSAPGCQNIWSWGGPGWFVVIYPAVYSQLASVCEMP